MKRLRGRAARVRYLRDVVTDLPRILFVGINPSLRSAEVGHHFASPGNPFWRLLHAAGLTPRLLTFAEDRALADHGMALTNLCRRPTRAAAELSASERAAGKRTLMRKIARMHPAVVALVGVSIYRDVFGARASGGAGLKHERLADAPVFVLPNPSGLNASYPGFEDKRIWFARLRAFSDEGRAG
jgi:TDG/mug DNA glycosylase family protein